MITQQSASARALVIISTIAAVLVLLLATAVHGFSGSIDTIDYVVQGGDSLWSISEDLAGEGADVRSIVAAIRDLNGLAEPLIHPGDILEIPAGR